MTLRRLRHCIAHLPKRVQWTFEAAWILALSYFIAYLETLAISNVRDDKFAANTHIDLMSVNIHFIGRK